MVPLTAQSAALLVSPAPVDGYPPVQHQARLLADAGYRVELVTVPLAWSAAGGVADGVKFNHPGVAVQTVRVFDPGRRASLRRAAEFIKAITRSRRRLVADGYRLVEIAYEPVGIAYSDMAPCRRPTRIAHFHECLQRLDTSRLERRLAKSMRYFQKIVVADDGRAAILRTQLVLDVLPLAVPNFPMMMPNLGRVYKAAAAQFEVIYCGSIGFDQKLDQIIDSVPHWPKQAVFSIAGHDGSAIAQQLKAHARRLGVEDRVRFLGWTDYDDLPKRLAQAQLGISLLDQSFEQWRTALGASNKRYQYMQAGLPQIGDLNPGVKELLEDQGIGYCLKSDAPTELASIVAAYAADPDRGHREGQRAEALHLSHYNYQCAFQPLLSWLKP
jgi:glycosyltransferase involved in cell wall biosynthesis